MWEDACFLTVDEVMGIAATASANFRVTHAGPVTWVGVDHPSCYYGDSDGCCNGIEIHVNRVGEVELAGQIPIGIPVESATTDAVCAEADRSFTPSTGTGLPVQCETINGNPIAYMSFQALFGTTNDFTIYVTLFDWSSGEPYDLVLGISEAIISSERFAALAS
jgi:hypothetical protein